MTILVTGGAGYIGSHTVRALRDGGFRVVVLDTLVERLGQSWAGFPLSCQDPQPEQTTQPPRANILPNLQPHPTGSLMPAATRARRAASSPDPAQQWLVLEPNRIEKQYWIDLWRYRDLFAILAQWVSRVRSCRPSGSCSMR